MNTPMKQITLEGGKFDGAVLDVTADTKVVKLGAETYLPKSEGSLVFEVQ